MINWQLSKQSGDKLPVSNDRRLKFNFFQWFIWNVVFMSLWSSTVKILISNWPRTRNLASFLKIKTGKIFSYHGHALVTLYVEFLCSDWSKFDRSLHAENLCSILKVVYFESWRWQSFRCQLVIFLTVFSHWMYKMKHSCYQELPLFMAGLFIGFFGWEMRRLSKFGNPISDGIVFVFHLA